MGTQHVGHRELVNFADDRVNLPRDKANELRAQARGLRERLETYLGQHPDFTLRKMILSGSLAKGTALRSLNDIDVACYISGADAPKDIGRLLEYLAERLRKAYPNFKPEQVKPQTYSVTVSFQGSGLDVDVVPILYDGDPDWYGNLVSQDDGSFLRTSIPRHLEFAKRRKQLQPSDFVQVVRLVKFWARRMKTEVPGFRFKSFMIEMILAKLCDEGRDFSNYPEALQHFFTYVAQSGLREQIAFQDYYPTAIIAAFSEPMQIIDPVNEKNNVAKLYGHAQVDAIVEAALDAGDAIDAALAAPTKRFYGAPSDDRIAAYETEVVELLKAGYLDTVTYGFKRGDNWIEPTLRYTAKDLAGMSGIDDDPGKLRPGADVSGASFYNYLTYSSAWFTLSAPQRESFEKSLPFQRTGAAEPGISGSLVSDRSYSAGGKALDRLSVRSY